MTKNFDLAYQLINKTDLEIKNIEKIINAKSGLTNKIYHIKMINGDEYKLRIANQNKYINRKLEKYIDLKLYKNDIVYYDNEGNFIKKWIIGKELTNCLFNNKILSKIITELNRLHNLNINKNIDVRYVKYYDDIIVPDKIKECINLYKKIVDGFDTKSFILCHNDCSCSNIILDKDDNVHIIDFEWSCLNHRLWDIANLIKDLELDFDRLNNYLFVNDNEFDELIKIIFCAHCYTYFWTTRMKLNKKIMDYQKHIITRLLYWYGIIKKYGN